MKIPPQSPTVCTVGLVDPLWCGHHETYFKAFIRALHHAGARVVAVCPKPEDLQELAAEFPDTLRVGLLSDPGGSRFFPGRDNDPILTHQRWQSAESSLSKVENETDWKIDFVFFAWLDSYLRFMSTAETADRLIGRPWAGLYFRNQHLSSRTSGLLGTLKQRLRGDFILRSAGCRVVAGVDEQLLPFLEEFCGKPVLQFPDITDESAGDPETPLARAITNGAKGRKVIGIVGLEKRKGFLTLMRVAKKAAERQLPWYFAFTGVLYLSTLEKEEAKWLRSFLDSKPDNVYIDEDAGPIPDGAPYNGVASTFDVFFAAYLNSLYNGSSNVLTKAALLKIPVVVTKGACLEERVDEFQMGVSIDEGDADECLTAIKHLLEGQQLDGSSLQPRFDNYFELHSHQRLTDHMSKMISMAVAN